MVTAAHAVNILWPFTGLHSHWVFFGELVPFSLFCLTFFGHEKVSIFHVFGFFKPLSQFVGAEHLLFCANKCKTNVCGNVFLYFSKTRKIKSLRQYRVGYLLQKGAKNACDNVFSVQTKQMLKKKRLRQRLSYILLLFLVPLRGQPHAETIGWDFIGSHRGSSWAGHAAPSAAP